MLCQNEAHRIADICVFQTREVKVDWVVSAQICGMKLLASPCYTHDAGQEKDSQESLAALVDGHLGVPESDSMNEVLPIVPDKNMIFHTREAQKGDLL